MTDVIDLSYRFNFHELVITQLIEEILEEYDSEMPMPAEHSNHVTMRCTFLLFEMPELQSSLTIKRNSFR
jgi:hypothetical protein